MLERPELGQTIYELANIFKKSSRENLEGLFRVHLNTIGLLLLEEPFPCQREFYGGIIRRPRNRIGEKEVCWFLGRQKGRAGRPSFILTSNGFTPAARDLAQRWNIELITFSKWAEYLLSGKILTANKGERYDIDFLA